MLGVGGCLAGLGLGLGLGGVVVVVSANEVQVSRR